MQSICKLKNPHKRWSVSQKLTYFVTMTYIYPDFFSTSIYWNPNSIETSWIRKPKTSYTSVSKKTPSYYLSASRKSASRTDFSENWYPEQIEPHPDRNSLFLCTFFSTILVCVRPSQIFKPKNLLHVSIQKKASRSYTFSAAETALEPTSRTDFFEKKNWYAISLLGNGESSARGDGRK